MISIIIVNWNGGEVFEDCLTSLAKIDYKDWELIVVDNGSTDGSVGFVQKIIKNKYQIIANSQNVGFAPANNQGVKVAKGEYILLLNNDTKVEKSSLTKMVAKMQSDKTIGAMQPKIYMMDRKGYLDNAGSYLNTIGFSEHWGYAEQDREEFNKEKNIFAAKGACLFTRKEIVDKVGLFDDEFKSYFEESDFCWRVWLAGYKVVYFPGAYIYHKVGFTSKRMSQIEINYYPLRNRLSSFYKNFSFVNLFRYLIVHLFFLFGLASYYLLKLQLSKSWMVFKAILWFIFHLPSLTLKRFKVQKLRVKADNQILPIIMHKTDFSHMFEHFKKVEANFK